MRDRLRLAGGAVVAALLVAAVVWWNAGTSGDAGERRSGAEASGSLPGVTVLQSRPDLRPPNVTVEHGTERPDDRLLLVSPRMENSDRDGATHQQGALGIDEQGRTRWFRPGPDGEPTTDVRVQRYRGEPVMTFWQGAASEFGIGRGKGVILDTSYRTVAEVQAGNGHTVDLHEFELTPRGTALVTIYARRRGDLSALGGPKDAQITEGIVQEIDVETGEVLFEWHSLDEVAPEESYRPLPEDPEQSYDYFHINSVEEDADGDLLVSARNTSAVYKIDRETGKLAWRLGGKESDFEMGPGTDFGLQHDARDLPGGVLQIFDNAAEDDEGAEQTASSVKRLRLDTGAMRATLVERFDQPDGEWAESQGNAVALPDGGVVVGWGSLGGFSRFGPDGELRFDAQLPAEYDSYRAYPATWTGRPDVPPAIHARHDNGQVTVAASWNGSTEVQAWQVLAGRGPDQLEPVGAPAGWRGLETRIVRATDAPYVAVEALDASGATLATSAAVRTGA